MALVVDILSWIFMSVGSVFVLLGGVGALRMPDLFTRIHAASLTDSAGAGYIIAGIILQAGFSLAAIKLLAILFFIFLTAPTAANALGGAGLLAGKQTDRATLWNSETKEE